MTKGFSLKSAKVEQTAPLHLMNANDELMWADGPAGEDGKPMRLPVRVILYGPASTVWAEQDAKASERAANRWQKRGKVQVDHQTETNERARRLAALTVAWENIDPADFDNKTGRDLSLAIYTDRELGFIADQVEKFVASFENFTQTSPTT